MRCLDVDPTAALPNLRELKALGATEIHFDRPLLLQVIDCDPEPQLMLIPHRGEAGRALHLGPVPRALRGRTWTLSDYLAAVCPGVTFFEPGHPPERALVDCRYRPRGYPAPAGVSEEPAAGEYAPPPRAEVPAGGVPVAFGDPPADVRVYLDPPAAGPDGSMELDLDPDDDFPLAAPAAGPPERDDE